MTSRDMSQAQATETFDLDHQGHPPNRCDPPAVHDYSSSSLNAVSPKSTEAMDTTPLPMSTVSSIERQTFSFAAPPSRPATSAISATSTTRKSGRLEAVRRRASVALDATPAVPIAGSKRERSSDLGSGSSKVRVVEPAMALERLQIEIAAKSDIVKHLEQTLSASEYDRKQATSHKRRLEEQVDVLQKNKAELEDACRENIRTVENLKAAHRSEIEALRANAAEEMSVRNSLDPAPGTVENSAAYKALDARLQTVSQSLANHELTIRQATDALAAKDAEIREHQSANAQLLEEQSCLKLELSDAQSSHKDAEDLRRDAVAQLNKQIEENQGNRDQLRQAKENLANVLRSLHTTEQTVRSGRMAEEQYKSEVAGLNQIIESKNSEHARLVSLTDSLNEKLERTSKLLEQKGIALEAQEGFKGQLDASRRELSTTNTKVSELTQKITDLENSARTMRDNHLTEIDTLTARLTESRNAADKAVREHQAQRREMLTEKSKALEIEREARKVKDKLLHEMQLTVNEAREENQVLKERIDGLELENKKLGKRRADEPTEIEATQFLRIRSNEVSEENQRLKERIAALEFENKKLGKRRAEEVADTGTALLDMDRRHDTPRRSGTPTLSVFSIVSSRREPQRPQVIEQDPQIMEAEAVGNRSDFGADLHQRLRRSPAVRDAHQTPREVSPDIAAPETYHNVDYARRASSTHPASRPTQQRPYDYLSGVQRPQSRASPTPGPSGGPSKQQPFTPDRLRSPSPSTSIRRSGTPMTPQSYNDNVTQADMREMKSILSRLLQTPETPPRPKKARYTVSPFKMEASPRPRSVEHNHLMAKTREHLSKLLNIKTDADMAKLDIIHVANPRDVENFEQGRIHGTYLEPLQICWDVVKCKWNQYLADLFALSLIRLEPTLTGQDEKIKEHFMQRIATLRAEFLKNLPRRGETSEETQTRISVEHQRTLHEKRIRSRQIELRERRTDDCAAGSSTEDEELTTMMHHLGNDGVSSDESDGRGNRIVRAKLWRNRAIINRMARADAKHRKTGPYGNRKPGAQLQRRIRRHHGPVSKKKVPAGKPINYYDSAFYHSLSLAERDRLEALPPVPFRGEYDPVDESLFD